MYLIQIQINSLRIYEIINWTHIVFAVIILFPSTSTKRVMCGAGVMAMVAAMPAQKIAFLQTICLKQRLKHGMQTIAFIGWVQTGTGMYGACLEIPRDSGY